MLHAQVVSGVRPPRHCTVNDALADWPAVCLTIARFLLDIPVGSKVIVTSRIGLGIENPIQRRLAVAACLLRFKSSSRRPCTIIPGYEAC